MSDFRARVQAELNDASLSAVESKIKTLENTQINLRNVSVVNAQFSQSALNNLQKQLNNLTANIRVQINGNNANNFGKQVASDLQSSVNSITQKAYSNITSQLAGHGIDDAAIKNFLNSVSHDANQANVDVTKLNASFREFQKGKKTVNGLEVAIQGVNRETGATVTMTQKWDNTLTNVIDKSLKFSQSFGQSTGSANTNLSGLVSKFKEMSQIRIKLNGLDELGKNAQEANALKQRYSVLSTEIKKLVSEITGIPISNLQALDNALTSAGQQSQNTSDGFNNLRIALAQALGQSISTSGLEGLNEKLLSVVMTTQQAENQIRDAARAITTDFSSAGASTQKINDLQSAITSLGTYGVEAQQKLDALKQTASNISSGGLNANEIVAQGARAKEAFAEVEAAVKRAKEAMAFDDSKAAFGRQLQEQLSALTPETEQFRQRLVDIENELQRASNGTDLTKLKSEFASVADEIRNTANATKDAATAQETLTKSDTLSNKIQIWMNQNAKAAKEFETELKQLQDKLKNNTDPKVLKQVGNEFNNIKSKAQAAGLTVGNFAKGLKNTVLQLAGLSSTVMVFQKAIQVMKQMYEEVLKVDTAMTELYRVTNLSSDRYSKLYDSMVDSAKKYGASLDDMINSTASWVRLGFDAETSNKLAEITSMYQHVTDLDEDTAVDNLVTAYKGFQGQLDKTFDGDQAAAIMRIADIYDKLGNEFAESAADVGQGLSKTASVLQVGGASIEEAAALFTGINEVLQDPATSGTALKILTLRIRGMKGELEELGEEVDENVDSISKIQTHILNLTGGQVNIFDDQGNFRDIYNIMEDIAAIYDDLSDPERADLLETIAGKNRANAVQALILNWQQVAKAKDAAFNAAGTAEKEQDIYMDSLKGKLDTLSATWQAFANDFLSNKTTGVAIEGLTKIIELLDKVVNTLGSIGTIAGAGGLVLLIKNFGSSKEFAHYGCESIVA